MSSSASSDKKVKQATLLQTWGFSSKKRPVAESPGPDPTVPGPSKARGVVSPESLALQADDDGEEDLLKALELSVTQYKLEQASRSFNEDGAATSCAGAGPSSGHPTEVLPGFDPEAGRTWIYPVNYPLRSYQFSIVHSCLYKNTLVTLPTGLGKTFIAAVVMYNFFRWYPEGKIVFMAPTKPLVAQQIEACFKIMGIPQVETVELNGSVPIALREKAWQQKRVLFMTPQITSNDLSRGLFPARHVKLLVVDEAHRAQGDYAYCQVVRELQKAGTAFRVLALSATPGTDLNNVRLMLQNLLISHIELRSEDSPDIVPYTFERRIEKVVVSLSEELVGLKNKFLTILEHYVKRLSHKGALFRRSNSTNPNYYTKFGLLQARNEFRQNPPSSMDRSHQGAVEGDFATAIPLYHAYGLLQQHGMRAFFNFMSKNTGPNSENRKLRYELSRMAAWQEIKEQLSEKFSEDAETSRLNASGPQLVSQFGEEEQLPGSALDNNMVLGHPKLEKLRDLVVQHFRSKRSENVATRAIIFSQYRDSVQEITACLHAYKPLVKVMEFVGQAGLKGKKGLTQKEQMEVVRRFREGGFNTLVATCVGEEGLDIGEVDLIVCYDVSKSPIRLVQRMGRTGRKRAGRIVVLVTEGKEEQAYNTSIYCKNSINKAILEKQKLANFLTPSPRMVPNGLEPQCLKMTMAERTFTSSKSDPSTGVAPSNTRRISGMLEKKSGKANAKKKKGSEASSTEKNRDASEKKKKGPKKDSKKKTQNVKEVTEVQILEELEPDSDFESIDVDAESKGAKSPIREAAVDVDRLEDDATLSDIELEVLQDLAAKIDKEEERSKDDADVIIPGCILGDEEEEQEIVLKPAPVWTIVSRGLVPGTLRGEMFKAAYRRVARTKYSLKLAEVTRGSQSFDWRGDHGEDYDLDLSEWKEDESKKKDDLMLSPVFNSQKSNTSSCPASGKSTTAVNRTSTPSNITASSKPKKVLEFDPALTPVRRRGTAEHLGAILHPITEEDNSKENSTRDNKCVDVADMEFSNLDLIFADSGFLPKQDEEMEERVKELYTPTQLAAMVCKKTAADGSVDENEREECPSDRDLFGDSQDDQLFLEIDEKKLVGRKEKSQDKVGEGKKGQKSGYLGSPNISSKTSAVSSFKIPDLSAFEASMHHGHNHTKPPLLSKITLMAQKDKSPTSQSILDEPFPSTNLECNSPDSSPLIIARKKKTKELSVLGDQSSDCSSHTNSSSLESVRGPKRRRITFEGIDSESSNVTTVRRKNIKKSSGFVLDEAEMSEDHGEDFEDDDERDLVEGFEESFVDDVGFTQTVGSQQRAAYLKSIRSPSSRFPQRLPPRPLPPVTADLFSQPVNQSSSSSYEDDSFVVDNSSDIEFESKLDELDLIEETEKTCVKKVPLKKKRVVLGLEASSSEDEERQRVVASPKHEDKAKEERLKRQMILQEQFKQRAAATDKQKPTESVEGGTSNLNRGGSESSSMFVRPDLATSKEESDKPTVIVNAAEVHKITELISCLKHEHNLSVQVRSACGATIILSRRLGLERRTLGEFCSGANRANVVKSCQAMNDLFDRPCIVLESDKPSDDGVVPRSIHTVGAHRTKYVDNLFSQLSESKIQFMFSESQTETASIAAALLKKELKKDQGLPKNLNLDKFQEAFLLPFYQSIPGVSYGTALSLVSGFGSLSAFANSVRATIAKRTNIEEDKAAKILEFMQRNFYSDLTAESMNKT